MTIPGGPDDRFPQDRRPGSGPDPYGTSRPGPRDASGPQDAVPGRPVSGRGSSGRFGGFPFPHYSTRTRRGTQVTVGGCCLPIPLGCLTALSIGAAVAISRAAAHRRG